MFINGKSYSYYRRFYIINKLNVNSLLILLLIYDGCNRLTNISRESLIDLRNVFDIYLPSLIGKGLIYKKDKVYYLTPSGKLLVKSFYEGLKKL